MVILWYLKNNFIFLFFNDDDLYSLEITIDNDLTKI